MAGIYSSDTLTVSNSTFSDNSGGGGGGISNSGTLTVSNSTFAGNSARAAVAASTTAATARVTVSNSTFSGNSATVRRRHPPPLLPS